MDQESAAVQKFLGIPRAWAAILCGALFYSYQFVLRVSPNVMHDELMQDFAMDATTFGAIIGFYSWSYAGVQIPLGIALDRFGPGRLLSLAALTCAASCFLFSATTSTFLASVSMLLMGLGSACGFLGSIKLGTTWFPPHQLTKVVALVMVFGTLGAGLGGSPLSILIDSIGWQQTMKTLGIIGVVLAGLIFLVVGRGHEPLNHEPPQNIFEGIKQVIRTPQAWLISFYGMLMYAPITVMGVAWGVPFLSAAYPITEKVAATIITTMFIGGALGSAFFSMLSDKLQQRNSPMLLGAIASFLIYVLIIFIPNIPMWMLYGLFFAAGFTYTAKSLSFACICEIMPPSNSAVAVGFINTVVMATGVVFHPLMGELLVYNWDGTMVNGLEVYDEWDFRFALTIVPICLFLAILVLKFIRETHHLSPLSASSRGAMYE